VCVTASRAGRLEEKAVVRVYGAVVRVGVLGLECVAESDRLGILQLAPGDRQFPVIAGPVCCLGYRSDWRPDGPRIVDVDGRSREAAVVVRSAAHVRRCVYRSPPPGRVLLVEA
jgi:hypothetical protein